jgi:hypothetical protein
MRDFVLTCRLILTRTQLSVARILALALYIDCAHHRVDRKIAPRGCLKQPLRMSAFDLERRFVVTLASLMESMLAIAVIDKLAGWESGGKNLSFRLHRTPSTWFCFSLVER